MGERLSRLGSRAFAATVRSAAADLPSPSADELCGPHTRYIVPGQGGVIETLVRGRAAPVGAAEDATLLERYRTQQWRIAPDGRSFRCQAGTDVARASVIVQLYASSLPIAIAAFDREQNSRAKRHDATNEKRNLAGLGPHSRRWSPRPRRCRGREDLDFASISPIRPSMSYSL